MTMFSSISKSKVELKITIFNLYLPEERFLLTN